MRIGLITPNPPSQIGGVERFTGSLVGWLRSAGVDVELFDRTRLQPHPRAKPASGKVAYLLQIEQLRRLVRRTKRCDLYLCNGACALAARPDVPKVTMFRGCYRGYFYSLRGLVPGWRWRLNRAWWTYLEKRAARNAHVMAVSPAVGRIVRHEYGIANVTVIENGIDVEHFRLRDKLQARRKLGLPARAFLGIYAGRFDVCKRLDLLLEMASRFQRDEGIILAVPGAGGTPRAPSKRHVPRLPDGMPQAHRFCDVTYQQMPLLLSAADCLLQPSTFEGCSFSVIEGMACGLPPLITPTGHAECIAAFHPALERCVIEAGHWRDVLDAFRRMKQDRLWHQTASRQARCYAVQHNSLETMGRAYLALFEKVLGCRPAHARAA